MEKMSRISLRYLCEVLESKTRKQRERSADEEVLPSFLCYAAWRYERYGTVRSWPDASYPFPDWFFGGSSFDHGEGVFPLTTDRTLRGTPYTQPAQCAQSPTIYLYRSKGAAVCTCKTARLLPLLGAASYQRPI